ncbi:hypothetical protein RHOFW104T7_05725 [Rhodanobacter thiooxydans]|uniref:Beta-glucuronidase C-terminal domain-containing protein n=1 Tax=Rhodanobacter thiooxydans TaxID=416169 RepID=A0A154QMI1_9GAMM|nr:hypothetical protein [Rhodanobacter thiooxydans]EIL99545.1 hypothetical protein UUA_08461 [Rhodanobacter thiooxydans LCS2]KZC25008.1 hypothetical protein RHOFW104T7_05725 [Rhodanobacter thiooxydans]MCW0202810.1 hypothetical protein [Rhodanobacter thiooxydans]
MNQDPVSQSRRRFLGVLGSAAAMGALAPVSLRAGVIGDSAANAVLTLATSAKGRPIAQQLIGLSFETWQLGGPGFFLSSDPGFFSSSNEALVGLLRRLNPAGVLRIGGITSDFALWSEYRGQLPAIEHSYTVTPAQLAQLAGFLKATGWKLIFGLGLFHTPPAMAAELAAAVQRAVGDQLLAIQIGNEPDGYRRSDGHTSSFDDYMALWRASAEAIRQRVAVPLAGPDTAVRSDWVLKFADQAEGVVALSRHYYRGAAFDPTSTINQLLSGASGFTTEVAAIIRVADARQLPFLLSEVNSYAGGKPGVSDTFASALWGGDFALACAQAGAHGINIHCDMRPVPRTLLDADENALAKLRGDDLKAWLDTISGHYTPIAGHVGLGWYARPLYYGLLLAQQFGGARFVESQLSTEGLNLTAYAADKGERRLVALFNKDLDRDAVVRLEPGRRASRLRLWRLEAASITEMHDVRLAGSEVDGWGNWSPRHEETIPVDDGYGWVRLPRGSAALAFIEA